MSRKLKYCLKKVRSRNPGAAWHKKEENLADVNVNNSVSNTGRAGFLGEGRAHKLSREKAEELNMPNPISKSGLSKLIVPAIIIGGIWWLVKRNKT